MVSPNIPDYSPSYCEGYYDEEYGSFLPSNSGWYNIKDSIVRHNLCGHNVSTVSDSFYINILPDSFNITLTGISPICPGLRLGGKLQFTVEQG